MKVKFPTAEFTDDTRRAIAHVTSSDGHLATRAEIISFWRSHFQAILEDTILDYERHLDEERERAEEAELEREEGELDEDADGDGSPRLADAGLGELLQRAVTLVMTEVGK